MSTATDYARPVADLAACAHHAEAARALALSAAAAGNLAAARGALARAELAAEAAGHAWRHARALGPTPDGVGALAGLAEHAAEAAADARAAVKMLETRHTR